MRCSLPISLLVAATALVSTQAASAADLHVKAPIRKAPVPAPPYDWSGLYVGAHIGGAWSHDVLTDNALRVDLNPGGTGFIGGLQAGYNWQTGILVYGFEADVDWTTFSGTSSPLSTSLGLIQASASKAWITTLAARMGLTWDRWLAYGKVGGGWVRGSTALNVVNGGTIGTSSATNGGWLLGAGFEYAFADNWTGKLEYDYIGLANSTESTPTVVSSARDVQMLKVGVNYQFGDRVRSTASAKGDQSGASGDTESLATASQNPIADMISVPFQNNTNFDTGPPFNRTQDILNIQPVIPMHLNADLNVISRTIAPLISQPSPTEDININGIGDITESLFLAPTHPGPVIWGVGPVFTMPSASNPLLGTGKVLLGPTAVALVTPGHWVIGALINNQWSVAGDQNRASVNAFLVQPFVNYNMAGGWFLSYSPIITANWNAPSGQQWTVPVGGGIGRVFKIGGQAYNASVQAYYNAVRPANTADWNLRVSLALLFPK